MREECGSTGLLAITTVADSVVKRFSFKREFHGLAKASSVVDLCLRHSREPLRTSNSDLVPDWAELVCIPSLFLQHDHVTYATDVNAPHWSGGQCGFYLAPFHPNPPIQQWRRCWKRRRVSGAASKLLKLEKCPRSPLFLRSRTLGTWKNPRTPISTTMKTIMMNFLQTFHRPCSRRRRPLTIP